MAEEEEEYQPKNYMEMLSKLGLSVMHDERLRQRLEEYQKFQNYIKECTEFNEEETPEETVKKIQEHVHEINRMLHRMSIPWGRAGSESWYARMMWGWSKIYTETIAYVDSVLKMMQGGNSELNGGNPLVQKEVLYYKLKHFFATFYLKYAVLIASISWRVEDVAPSWSVVVQQPPVIPYGPQVIPSSQLPATLPKPAEKAYPPRLKTEVGEE